jgi:hypothetical protein
LKNYICFFMIAAFCWILIHPVEAECSKEVGMDMTAEENAIVELVNALRTEHGMPAVTIDPLLNQVAGDHSQDMAGKKIVDDGPPVYQTPFERAVSKRLSDMNHLVVVAAGTLDALKHFVQSDTGAIEKLLSPAMTHAGIKIFSAGDEVRWLTIHMLERVITFTNFKLETGSGVAPGKSITIYGVTAVDKVKVDMIFGQEPDADAYDKTKIVMPDAKRNFSVSFDFDLGDGQYGFLFRVYENGQYRKSNYFDITVK